MLEFLFNTNHKSTANYLADSSLEGWPIPTLTHRAAYISSDVLPGKGGRLHYLSTEWGARSIDNSYIPEGTPVKPVMRQGNTWLVAVEQLLPSHHVA